MGTPEDHSPTHGNTKEGHETDGEALVQIDRRKKFILVGLLRWLGTAVLAALFYVIILVHQGRTLTSGQKSIFDALIVAISLALGLNSAASLRHIAMYARRWFEGKRNVKVKEIEVHSFVALLGLLLRTPLHLVKVACVIWLLLNLAIQVAIAAIGLTFKAEPGIQEIYLDSALGDVAIPDMTQFARVGRFNDGARPQSVAAHILGNIGTSYEYSKLPSEVMTNAPIARFPYAFWDAGDHWEFIFTKSAPAPGPQDLNFLSVYSDQAVRSLATCRTPPYTFQQGAGVLKIQHTDAGNKTVLFPSDPLGDESMMYLTVPVLRDAGSNSTGECGPGCSVVYAVEPGTGPSVGSGFDNPDSSFYYYECNITVQPAQDHAGIFAFSPTSAAVAAQAIALSGARAPSTNTSSVTTQFSAYELGLELGQAQNNNATAMARMLSRFAIGVVAAAARTDPKVLVQGYPPRQGVRLVLDKPVVFAAILIATAVVQLVMLMGVVVLVQSVEKRERRLLDGRGDI